MVRAIVAAMSTVVPCENQKVNSNAIAIIHIDGRWRIVGMAIDAWLLMFRTSGIMY